MRRRRKFRVKCERCEHEFQSTKDPSLFSVQCGSCGGRNTSLSEEGLVAQPQQVPSTTETVEPSADQPSEPTEIVSETSDWRDYQDPNYNFTSIMSWLRISPDVARAAYDVWYNYPSVRTREGLYSLFQQVLHFDDTLARIFADYVVGLGSHPWVVINQILAQPPSERRQIQGEIWRRMGVPV